MIASTEYVAERFLHFNSQMFGGKLPMPTIELVDAGTFMGQFVADRQHTAFRLRINSRVDLPTQTLDDVIIHEMIHYFIAYNGLVDTTPHGAIFRSIMESINANYGRKVAVSTPASRQQVASKKSTWHVIAAVEMADGSLGVKVLPRVAQKVMAFEQTLKRAANVKAVSLFLHNNPFFNRFPTSVALRVHPIDRELFQANIDGAKTITIQGTQMLVTN